MTNEEAIKSEQNGKVCCNCRHCIREVEFRGVHYERIMRCICEIDGTEIDYVHCLSYWCRHWAKKKEKEGAEE